ncbi:unnamed protein product [Rhizoctonia solani]|uniref:Protein kinase domain-containing protein n=1 Tax=Rhizoctonia solani TaxID=456999 RepID=A0A8H3DSP8_9AGAM|nr:unnamed protein product [Rhizoctonia solani]
MGGLSQKESPLTMHSHGPSPASVYFTPRSTFGDSPHASTGKSTSTAALRMSHSFGSDIHTSLFSDLNWVPPVAKGLIPSTPSTTQKRESGVEEFEQVLDAYDKERKLEVEGHKCDTREQAEFLTNRLRDTFSHDSHPETIEAIWQKIGSLLDFRQYSGCLPPDSDSDLTPRVEVASTAPVVCKGPDSELVGRTELVQSNQMTSLDIFECLVKHGCDDLTRLIDPGQYSSCRVAEGAFGDIWKGQMRDGTSVAVKVLRFGLLTDGGGKSLKRMMREIYTWSKLDHENVQKLLGVTMIEGRLGMISRWMAQGNLRDYLERNQGLDRHELCVQISKGVAYIHTRGMVHGDIKACNILVSSDGILKLTDFDHSFMADCSLLFTDTTRIGGGTPRWMPPNFLPRLPTSEVNRPTCMR